MSDMVERVFEAIKAAGCDEPDYEDYRDMARAAIRAMRELSESPGPRYAAGEYSRENVAAFIDDVLEPKNGAKA